MRRREFTAMVAATVLAGRHSCFAQQQATRLIGFLSSGSAEAAAPFVAAFEQGLGETGYIPKQNIAVEYRWASGRYERLPELVAELIARRVELIFAASLTAAAVAKKGTSTIPIVFAGGGDPVELGLLANLAHPGGNLTGIDSLGVELTPKRFELVHELVPQANAIALLANPNSADAERQTREVQAAARAAGLSVPVLTVSNEGEIAAAYASLGQLGAGALVVSSAPLFNSRPAQLVALASRYAIPTIYERREFADGGGLISYGPSLAAVYRQAGVYAGRVLNGENPANLPVQQPTKFELVINLRTAKALGLPVPPSLLARADEVIE